LKTDFWVCQKIAFFRGTTPYQGKHVACVVVEPISTPQLTAEQRLAIENRKAGDVPPPPAAYDGPNDDPQAA
jgi:hypothetical protein